MKTLLTNGFKAELKRKTDNINYVAESLNTSRRYTVEGSRRILIDKSQQYQSLLEGYISAMDDSELFTDDELNDFYADVHDYYLHTVNLIESFPTA